MVAEINSIQLNSAGHCYLELIEKDSGNEQIIAKARATIWAFTFRMLRPYFETSAGQPLSEGMKVLINVELEFHELYGFSLNVKDIDPAYTLGEAARQRLETIRRLKSEGIFDMNHELHFPEVPQHIAVISSPTAAGYQDFMKELTQNSYRYSFYCKLFPAVMQGNDAVNSIISALDDIFRFESFFDLVVIIRGGGSQADLSIFDSYILAGNIAQFPLPVITGIGHDKDESVSDMVAHISLKTPTAVAGFLIESLLGFEEQTKHVYDLIMSQVLDQVNEATQHLSNLAHSLAPRVQRVIHNEKYSLLLKAGKLKKSTNQWFNQKVKALTLKNYQLSTGMKSSFTKVTYLIKDATLLLKNHSKKLINNQEHKLSLINRTIDLLNPDKILNRGYSLTLVNGKVIRDVTKLNKSQLITTRLAKAILESRIENIKTRK